MKKYFLKLFLKFQGKLPDCCRLAAEKSADVVTRISTGNCVDTEETPSAHENVRADLYETLPSAKQETLTAMLKMERKFTVAAVAYHS